MSARTPLFAQLQSVSDACSGGGPVDWGMKVQVMSSERLPVRHDVLLIFLLAYAVASLVHYGHNAAFLDDYPNLPAWLSRAQVYAGWLGVTAIGLAGYLLVRSRHQLPGLIVLAVYGLLGLDGLGHYAVAPLSGHTPAMNFTIWLEVASAVLLLAAVASFMLRLSRTRRENWRR